MSIRSGDLHRGWMATPIRRACTVAVLILAPSAVLGQTRGGFDGGAARGGGGFGGAGLGIGLGIIGGVIAPMLRRPPPDRDGDVQPPPLRRPPPAASRSDGPVPARSRPAPEPKAGIRPPTRPTANATAPRPPAPRHTEKAPPAPSRGERATRPALPPALPPAPPPATARNASPPGPGARPAADEPGLVPGEVLVTFGPSAPADAPGALARRAGLRLTASERFALVPLTLHRYAIRPGRSVAAVVRALQADPQVAAAQPNHVYGLVGTVAPTLAGAQYAVAKLRLAEAQEAATGRDVAVAVIDSGVDATHPALAGAVAQSWDAIAKGAMPPGSAHAHGTAVAGLVGARGPLASPAPEARLLAIRAFSGAGEARPSGAQGTTVHVLRAVDWAAAAGARVVNMSFAGPADTLLSRFLAACLEPGARGCAERPDRRPRQSSLDGGREPPITLHRFVL